MVGYVWVTGTFPSKVKVPSAWLFKLSVTRWSGLTASLYDTPLALNVREAYPSVVATEGTVRSGLYSTAFAEAGIEMLQPTPEKQVDVMKAIYQYIKAGNLIDGCFLLRDVANELVTAGAEMIICGCTEVSLVLKDSDLPVPVLDPLQVLAEASMAEALPKEHV